jgi:hypothetical protein
MYSSSSLNRFPVAERALIAENVFLRKQLAFYQEHQVKPRRLTELRAASARLLVSFLRLEVGSRDRSTSHAGRLAS